MIDSGRTKAKRQELLGIVSPLIVVEAGCVVPSRNIGRAFVVPCSQSLVLEFRGSAVQASPIPGKPADSVE
jgi:hypothetical protein